MEIVTVLDASSTLDEAEEESFLPATEEVIRIKMFGSISLSDIAFP